MPFSRKRGRPSQKREKIDKGTAELQRKMAANATTETVDLCLKKGLIDNVQHSAAIRLRWLYTLRFGAPDISCYNPEKPGKSCFRVDDEAWLYARRQEYEKAMAALVKAGCRKLVVNACIFNTRPDFMLPYMRKNIRRKDAMLRHAEYLQFRDGLDAIAEVFGFKSRKVAKFTPASGRDF